MSVLFSAVFCFKLVMHCESVSAGEQGARFGLGSNRHLLGRDSKASLQI